VEEMSAVRVVSEEEMPMVEVESREMEELGKMDMEELEKPEVEDVSEEGAAIQGSETLGGADFFDSIVL
jgi:hypothetical protein